MRLDGSSGLGSRVGVPAPHHEAQAPRGGGIGQKMSGFVRLCPPFQPSGHVNLAV